MNSGRADYGNNARTNIAGTGKKPSHIRTARTAMGNESSWFAAITTSAFIVLTAEQQVNAVLD